MLDVVCLNALKHGLLRGILQRKNTHKVYISLSLKYLEKNWNWGGKVEIKIMSPSW